MRKMWAYLSPSWAGLAIYFVISIGALVVGSYNLILSLASGDSESVMIFKDLIRADFNHSTNLIDNLQYSAEAVTLLFWAVVGAMAYLLAISLFGFFSKTGLSLLAEWKFVHPNSYQTGDYIKGWLLKASFHSAFLIVLLAYILVFTNELWPIWTGFFARFLSTPMSTAGIAWLIISVTGFMFSLHVITVLLRAVFLRKHLFGNLK